MTRQDEAKEQAAQNYCKFQPSTKEGLHSYKQLTETFIAGALWREQQAAGDFDEWWTKEPVSDFDGIDAGHVERAWQASTLNSAKLLAEKDAEIKKLEELVADMRTIFWSNGVAFKGGLYGRIKALLGEE